MQTKSVLYAAVGAPVVVARKVGDKVNTIKDRVGEEKATRSKAAGATFETWATEGERVVTRVSEGKVVEEISSKVDLDQAKEQVSRLRDQLEDMLATWRTSFRPEKTDENTDVKDAEKEGDKTPSDKAPSTKKPSAKKPAVSKPATKTSTAKTSATKTTKSSTGAKTDSTKTAKAS